MSDLDPARIAAELTRLGSSLGPVHVVDATGSTNDDARALARAGAGHGTTIFADTQSAGRGRGAHRWYSPAGEGLYGSTVWHSRLEPQRLALLALAVGVGVARAIDRHLEAPRARIKWPNDVFVDDRKIAGILVEATHGPSGTVTILGVGLNVLTRSFPDEFADVATSLALAGGRHLDRSDVAAHLLASMEEACRTLESGDDASILAELAARDWLAGRAVSVGDATGVAAGIDAQGRLLVRTPSAAIVPVVSGEVFLTPASG